VNCWPKPKQRTHPPVWIPGGSSVKTWDCCTDDGFLYCDLSFQGYRRAEVFTDGFCVEAQHPYRAELVSRVEHRLREVQSGGRTPESGGVFEPRHVHGIEGEPGLHQPRPSFVVAHGGLGPGAAKARRMDEPPAQRADEGGPSFGHRTQLARQRIELSQPRLAQHSDRRRLRAPDRQGPPALVLACQDEVSHGRGAGWQRVFLLQHRLPP
jgi:hypothetical protein